MGVYIPSMKMPDKCGECRMHFLSSFPKSYVCCQITDRIPKTVGKYIDSKTDLDIRKSSIMAVKRPNWCPLVEVPVPHGRLADCDAVEECLKEVTDGEMKDYAMMLLDWAVSKRTVIEREDE